jgi:SAM-dependent methyltransferase
MTEATLYDFPKLYDSIVRTGPCEAFYRDLAYQIGGPILELACGTGRLTIPLARDGHDVVGLDASSAMLRSAKSKTDGLDIMFVHSDMRNFDLGRRFPLIILSCNSLAHLTSNEDLKAGLDRVAKHLAPGGVFAFDVINPDIRVLAQSHSECVRLDVGPNPSSAIPVEEFATYDPVQQIRTAQWRVLGGPVISSLNLRLFFPQEIPLLLVTAGLELLLRYGDFACNPLSRASLNQVCIARPALPGQS